MAAALAELARTDPDLDPPTRWVAAGSSEEAVARLEIYAGMYFFRLLETLRGDYPKLFDLLGSEPFAALAREYLDAYPSTDPSVRHVGGSLSRFLRDHPRARQFPYIEDLAAIEWARVEVFDRPSDGALLEPAALRSVPAERWPEITFAPISALRLLDLSHPADEIWLALDADAPLPAVVPGTTCVLVWRQGFSILQRRADAREAEALRRLLRGEPFAHACDALAAADEAAEDSARVAVEALVRWIHDGLLSTLRLPR